MSNQHPKNLDSVESRRSTAPRRRMSSARFIPIVCTAAHAWYLNRWDDFMVPKLFSRIVLAIGQPHPIPADAPDQLEPQRLAVQAVVMSLVRESGQVLKEVHA